VTGSLLAGLEIASSDIDFIVYGNSWFTARDIIKHKKEQKNPITEISDDMWIDIYKKRKPDITFDEFLVHEIRKGNRGMVGILILTFFMSGTGGYRTMHARKRPGRNDH